MTLLALAAASTLVAGLVGVTAPLGSAPPAASRSRPTKLPAPATPADQAKVAQAYGALPLSFEPNVGQADPSVRFLARGAGYRVSLRPGEADFTFAKAPPTPGADPAPASPTSLRMGFVGANPAPHIEGESPLPGTANYFLGDDPRNWRTGVPTFGAVTYHDIYPGIDLVFYGRQGRLEYDFVVAAGADPSPILVDFGGAKPSLDPRGGVAIASAGPIGFEAPVIYQQDGRGRRLVEGGFALRGDDRVGFVLGPYDRTKPLVIDPVLVYSGVLEAWPYDVAVDDSGSAYLTGTSYNTSFAGTGLPGVKEDAVQPTHHRDTWDAFVLKINPKGTAIDYATYLGGGSSDLGFGITVDGAGNAYVTGTTTSDPSVTLVPFPTTAGAFSSGVIQGFVTKLNRRGTALVYSIGFPAQGRSIAINAAGEAYVTGVNAADSIPTTPGAFQTTPPGGAFVTQFTADGSGLVYSTYLGPSGFGLSIAIDPAGNAYVLGSTGAGFPTTERAFQRDYAGSGDLFVAKLGMKPVGRSDLLYSTYLGGTSYDHPFRHENDTELPWGRGLAVDDSGQVYVTGGTYSDDFPTTSGAFQPGCEGLPPDLLDLYDCTTMDAFVTKIDTTAEPGEPSLVYSTFLGGTSEDEMGYDLGIDTGGHAYVIGETRSFDFPTTVDAMQRTRGTRGRDYSGFMTQLNPQGSGLVYSTYLGGSTVAVGYPECPVSPPSGCPAYMPGGSAGLALDRAGSVYLTGIAGPDNYPTTAGSFGPNFHSSAYGNIAGFLTKLGVPDFILEVSPASRTVGQGQVATYEVTITPTAGFSGEVALEVAGLPPGATGVFDPNPATTSSVLTVATAASTPAGTYPLTVTGASGRLSHSASAELVVVPPDFSLRPAPASRSVLRGDSTTYTVTIASSGGFADPVKLSVGGLPAATSASFSPNPATASNSYSSTLTVATTRKTTLGTFTLTITGTGGGVTRTTTVTLTVTRR